jgi:hypothetical protein
MNIVRMSTVAAQECERQQVGLDSVARLLEAAHVVHRRAFPNAVATEPWWKWVAGIIEPRNNGHYRCVPVTFADMSQGIPWSTVPRAMETWWAEIPHIFTSVENASFKVRWVDTLIRDFLKIHPFVDGNGRTAWLLRVWMLDQWDNPQPLPNYFPQNQGKQTV